MKKLVLCLIMVGLCAGVTKAQSGWLSDTRQSLISIEWDKPLFDNDMIDRDEVAGMSSSMFLTGHIKVADNFRIAAELPISYFGYQHNNPSGGDENSTVLGNVYAGGIYDFETRNRDNHFYVELGVRFPTAREPRSDKRFGSLAGIGSEAADRLEAFIWDTWTIPLIGNFMTPIDGPFAVKFRLGSIYDIYVDDLKSLDNELYLIYGISGLYQQPKFEVNIGFSGRNPYVGNNPDFIDDGFTQLRAGVSRPFRNVVPGVYVRQPLGDNYSRMVDFAYGFLIEIRR